MIILKCSFFLLLKNTGNSHQISPPGSGDGRLYANEITNAVAKFTSPNGLFIFTSSGGVYTENSGGVVDENSDVVQVRKYFVVMITA